MEIILCQIIPKTRYHVFLIFFVCYSHIVKGNGTARNCISERVICMQQCCSSLTSLVVQRIKRAGFITDRKVTLSKEEPTFDQGFCLKGAEYICLYLEGFFLQSAHKSDLDVYFVGILQKILPSWESQQD